MTEEYMRTNVVIDDKLMERAVKSGHYPTKKAAIEQGLKLLVQINSQKQLRELKGKILWEGDLEAMRQD
jgi:Arc/MetJ family transcription regulator